MKLTRKLLSICLSLCIFFTCMAGIKVPTAAAAETTPASTTDDPRIIVSLGDSYSAGEGIEPFYGQQNGNYSERTAEQKVASADWLAHRSTKAWGGMLTLDGVTGTMAANKDTNWYFAAASGAEIAHLTNNQPKDYNYGGQSGSAILDRQLKVFEDNNLTGKVDYVTLTIGGNDMGFTDIMTTAFVEELFSQKPMYKLFLGQTFPEISNGSKTLAGLLTAARGQFSTIKSGLKTAYSQIENAAGSQAGIIVAGYPTLLYENSYDPGTDPSDKVAFTVSMSYSGTDISIYFPAKKAHDINKAVSDFNAVIKAAVDECRTDGMNIHFVSVAGANSFNGKEAYSGASALINGITLREDGDQNIDSEQMISAYSFHPNASGAAKYAAAVQAKIDELEAAAANAVSYIDATGNTQTVTEYTSVKADTTAWTEGWYVVDSTTPIGDRVAVTGDVKLILCDGITLTASKGINVDGTNKLTIYAQSTDENTMGALTATGGEDEAGIGGGFQGSGGNITINGGIVNATGGQYAAGIGGGNEGDGGTIKILGGQVTALAGTGASAVGAGYNASDAGITLGWTNEDDFIDAQGTFEGTVSFADGKSFVIDEYGTLATASNIAGKKLVPATGYDFTVTFKDGEDTLSTRIVPTSTGKVIKPVEPTKDNYIFASWYENETCKGDPFDFENNVISENITLHAKWVTPDSFTALQVLIDKTSDGGMLTLNKNYTALSGETPLIIKNKTITIDLNGHTIDRALTEATTDGHVLEVNDNAALTIRDTAGGGKITGGYGKDNGGGIKNNGSLTINGGSITGNKAEEYGGGVMNYGVFTLTGGTITDNTAGSGGGGVANNHEFNIGNNLVIDITGNKLINDSENNLYLYDNKIINIIDLPKNGSQIGINTQTVPSIMSPVKITDDCKDDLSYLKSDLEGIILVKDGNAAKLAVQVKVIFEKNDNSSTTSEQLIPGGIESILNENPFTRENYNFSGWNTEAKGSGISYNNRDSITVTSEIKLYAQWTRDIYLVKFIDEDGTELQSSDVAFGETPKYNGAVPTKASDAQYTYTFDKWDSDIVAVTRDATYKATYTTTTNKYKITFKNYDGTVLQSSEVEYGETPKYTGETPVKEPDEQYNYIFAKWDSDIVKVTGDATYTATFKQSTCRHTSVEKKVENKKEPTCTEEGSYDEITYCELCKEELSRKTITEDPTGHKWGDWEVVKKPTVTEKGTEQRVCANDPTHIETREIEKLPKIVYKNSFETVSWQKGSGKALTWTIHRAEDDKNCILHYLYTLLNGEKIPVDAKSGSTIITISAEILEKLSAGTHTITVVFDDGEVTLPLLISAATPSPDASPTTGDNSNPALWYLLTFCSLAGLVLFTRYGRKRAEE